MCRLPARRWAARRQVHAARACRWRSKSGKGTVCGYDSSTCSKPLKASQSTNLKGTPTFIAAAGFLFLNQAVESYVSNFQYSFDYGSPPAISFTTGPPMIMDIVNNGLPIFVKYGVAITMGSTTTITNSDQTTMTGDSTMGNTYSSSQSLSFSPPKIHMTKSSSHTSGYSSTQSWGYSETQQTSWTQSQSLQETSTWSETVPLKYGNTYYAVAAQYKGTMNSVPFIGTNVITLNRCNTPLCVAAGVNQTGSSYMTQSVGGFFSGTFYSEASAVSARREMEVQSHRARSP